MASGKIKKFNAEQLSSSDDDEDLYQPVLNNDHAETQDNVAISEVSSREYETIPNEDLDESNEMEAALLRNIDDALAIQIKLPEYAKPLESSAVSEKEQTEDNVHFGTVSENDPVENQLDVGENEVPQKKVRARTERKKIERNLHKYKVLSPCAGSWKKECS